MQRGYRESGADCLTLLLRCEPVWESVVVEKNPLAG